MTGVFCVALSVLWAGGVVALGVVYALSVGLRHYPRARTWASVAGAGVAIGVFVLQLAVPATNGAIAGWPVDYFVAMGSFLRPDIISYNYFWGSELFYQLGLLTPLIAVGGAFAVAAGYPAWRSGVRVAVFPLVIGICAVLAFVVGAVMSRYLTLAG